MVKMFVYLLLSCNTEPGNFHGETVLPGEVIVGRKMLSERLHMPERVVRSTLDKLASTGEIVRWTNNHFTKISIRNWDKYQMVSLSNQTPTERQPLVQPNPAILNLKTMADEEKTANRLSNQTPTERHKQEERIIEESISCRDTKEATAASGTPPVKRKRKDRPESPEEVVAYCKSRGNDIDGVLFFDKMEARGWVFKDGRPVKDWKACIRTWERYQKDNIARGNPPLATHQTTAESWKGKTRPLEEKDIGGDGFL